MPVRSKEKVSILMDVVLLKVNNRKKVFQSLGNDFSGVEPPLWIILTAAYLRDQGISVAVIDAEAENLSQEETIQRIEGYDPLLVSVIVSGTNPSASTINMTGVSEFLKAFKLKHHNILTSLSGLHPSALPRRTMEEETVDFLIEGEGFSTLKELVAVIKEGDFQGSLPRIKGLWYRSENDIIANERAPNVADLGTLPMPAWDLLPMDRYRAHNWHCFGHIEQRSPYAVVYTSLGCPFKCSFCCINTLFGGPGIRYRPPRKVVEEIDHLVKTYGVKNIKVLDEIFILKWPHVEEICDGLIALGHDLNLWVYGRVDTVKEHMLKKMKKAGINWIAYGFESGSKKVRDGVSKGRFNEQQIKEIVRLTHAAGIEIVSNFIFGLPDDDLETMQETLDMAKELNCAYANFYCAMAYPGSQLYEEAVQQGVELPDAWNGYSQFSVNSLPLATKHLSSGQVLKFRDEAFNDYYNDPRYLKRIREKFGSQTVDHIQQMCSVSLKRDHYDHTNAKLFAPSE